MIRGGDDNRLVDVFVGAGVIAVGYPDIPDGRRLDRYDITERLRDRGWTVPETRAEMFVQFVHQIGLGHLVVMPDTPRGDVVVGRVVGDYELGPVLDDEDGYRHRRPVEWLGRHDRSLLPESTRDLYRQRTTLAEHTSPLLLAHLEAVERGEVMTRDAAEVDSPKAPRARAERAPRPSASRASRVPKAQPLPKAPAAPTTRTCTSCFLTKSVDLFPGAGETCVDCA